MSIPRIYQPETFAVGTTVNLQAHAYHHLVRVLRAKVGDEVILFNGQGGEFLGVIQHLDKKKGSVTLTQFLPREVESLVEIYLAQGIARGEKMDFIIQKAVELGVTRIIPLMCKYGNVRLSADREANRLRHWQNVIISACEQCGRNRVPEILPPVAISEWIATVKADLCLVLSPHVKNETALPASVRSIALLIGPEGGLSDEEVAEANAKNFIPLSLGPRILRTETATVASLAMVQARWGDFESRSTNE